MPHAVMELPGGTDVPVSQLTFFRCQKYQILREDISSGKLLPLYPVCILPETSGWPL